MPAEADLEKIIVSSENGLLCKGTEVVGGWANIKEDGGNVVGEIDLVYSCKPNIKTYINRIVIINENTHKHKSFLKKLPKMCFGFRPFVR